MIVSIFGALILAKTYTLDEALNIIQLQAASDAVLNSQLNQARQIITYKDALLTDTLKLVADLENRNEDMLLKVEEGIKKGWQLEDLQRMMFGRKSEKFIPENSSVTAIQPTLGPEFDQADIADIIAGLEEQRANRTDEKQPEPQAQTSRKNKLHKAHKGRRNIGGPVETVIKVLEPTCDTTGMKCIGKKRSVFYELHNPDHIEPLRRNHSEPLLRL